LGRRRRDPNARDGHPHQRRRPLDHPQLQVHLRYGDQPKLRPSPRALPDSDRSRLRIRPAGRGGGADRGRARSGRRAPRASAIGSLSRVRRICVDLRAALLDVEDASPARGFSQRAQLCDSRGVEGARHRDSLPPTGSPHSVRRRARALPAPSRGTKAAETGGRGGTMNRDELEGKKENLKGRVKEAAGVLTGNKDLEVEGSDERAGGAAQEELGQARRKVGEAIEDLGKKVKD